jgi:hypothetical protein
LTDLRVEDRLVGFQRLVWLEMVDDRHIPLGQALKSHLLLAYTKTPTGRLVLAPTGLSHLFEVGLGLLTLAGLNELRKAIYSHELLLLVLMIVTYQYSTRRRGEYLYVRASE